MTPPFLRSLGRPHGGDLASTSSRVGEIRLSPQLTRLSELVSRSRDLASDRGRESLAQILPNCAGNPNCSPDLSLLPAAIEQGAAAARGNPALYRMVLNFLAAQLLSTTNLEEQTAIRNRAREIARQALTAISDPGFSPEAEDPEHLDEPVRTKTRMLFDISCTLSALLAQPTSEGYSEADRALLGDYFHQMLSGMEQTRVRSAINPNNPPFPEYFERFVRAQAAILENDREGAFRQLLATRALFQEMEPERRGRPLPQLVETSAEMTLQSMPRDAAGEHVENLRTLLSLEALGYFYQVDFAESHAESELPVSQRRNQALNLVAGVYLNAGLSAANASELVDRLNDLGESRAPLLQAMERRYSTDHAFQEAVGRLYTGNLGDTSRRRAIFEEMLGDAQTTARHLRSHRNEQPYQTVFSRDREGRNLGRSIEALRGNEVLIANLRTGLGLGENAGAEAISRQLSEMGPLLPIFLQSLPELVRNDDHNRSFFDSIRAAAQGYRGDGMRSNVEGPLVDMVESLNELARGDDRYAPAYHAFFQNLQNLEQIAPDATLSPALRRSARRYAEALDAFSWGRVARHLAAPESVGMMVAGIALTELAPIWLLRGARIPFLRGAEAAAAVRTSGEMGMFVRGGQITWQGELAVGMGVGLAMQTGSLGMHMAFGRAEGVSVGQEFNRIGIGSLAYGTLFSMVAMGGTVLGGRLLRRGLLPEGATLSPTRQVLGHVGLRVGNWALGGGLMLGSHSLTAAVTGHRAMPTGEQAAEVFLSMALWDMGAAGLRFGVSQSRYWHHQIGPFRTRQMLTGNLEAMLRRAPELAGERAFLESYLQAQLANPTRFHEITRAIARQEVPRLVGSGNARRLIFTPAPLSTDAALTRTGAARVILELNPDQAARVRRVLDSDSFGSQPGGIGLVRFHIHQLLGQGRRNPRVWVRARLEGDNIRFEILPREPSDAERENTFRMDANGIRNLQTQDQTLRAIIAGYQNEMFTPILPPSPGRSSARRASPEAATAAHRPAAPAARDSNPPPVDPAESLGSQPGSQRDSEPPPPPADEPAETGSVDPLPPPTGVSDHAPHQDSAPATPPPPPPAEPIITRTEGEDHDPQSVTAQLQPTQALLDLAQRTGPVAAPVVEITPGGSPRRGDETIRFSTEQERRARTASRPDIPLEDPEPTTRRQDLSRTRRIEGQEAEELRQRLAAETALAEAQEAGREDPAAEASTEAPRVPPQSEAPIDLEEGDFVVETEGSEIPPAPPSGGDEFDFSGLLEGEQGNGNVTLRPPRVPAEAAALPAETRGPPPLPPRRPNPAAPAARTESDSDSGQDIQRLRRHLQEMGTDPERTAAVQVPSPGNYDAFAQEMFRFIDRLDAEVATRGRAQREYDQDCQAQGVPRQMIPYSNLFTVEVSPSGAMEIVTSVENLRYRDHSYFTLRRVAEDPSRPRRFAFRLDGQIQTSPEMEAQGWGEFLRRFFE